MQTIAEAFRIANKNILNLLYLFLATLAGSIAIAIVIVIFLSITIGLFFSAGHGAFFTGGDFSHFSDAAGRFFSEFSWVFIAIFIFYLLAMSVIQSLLYSGQFGLVHEMVNNTQAQRVNFKIFFSAMKKFFWRLFGLFFIIILIALAAIVLACIIFYLLSMNEVAIVVLAGILILILAIMFIYAPIILISDDCGIFKALGTSINVSFIAFARYILPLIIAAITVSVIMFLLDFISKPLSQVVYYVLSTYLGYVFLIYNFLIYRNLKERH